jgi:dipeptidase D
MRYSFHSDEIIKMDNKIRNVFDLFQQISAIPRCSKNEEKICSWIIQWALEKHFDFKKDSAGNLLISVPPSPGYETAPGIIIQGHMDMVCEKTAGSGHDFSNDPIELIFEDQWVRAKDTSLGADNGIGIALAMAIASDKLLSHPPIELLFTVDEETGLTGAGYLDDKWLKGKFLLNIDSEEDSTFTIGCAGGVDTRIKLSITFEAISKEPTYYHLKVHGLRGGHSGVDIHKQRANAIKILARTLLLIMEKYPIQLIRINGGSAHNAIPREADAMMALSSDFAGSISKIIREFETTVQQEFENIEPELKITFEKMHRHAHSSGKIISEKHTLVAIHLLCGIPHGIYTMSHQIPGLVETSNNLAKINTNDSVIEIITSQRSNIMSRLAEIKGHIKAVSALAGAETINENAYPPWQPRMDSPLLSRCMDIHTSLFGIKPHIKVIHAGLECGIIGSKYPNMDMISLGPTIKGAHSPEEKLHIPSVGKIRTFLETLLASFTS